MIPDWDILHYIDYFDYGIEMVCDAVIDWMVTQVERIIEAKKEQIYKIKPGAVMSSEPKVVWVKMLQRMTTYEKILTVRSKFNQTMERIMSERRNHYILDVNHILRDPTFFTRENRLNGDGKVLYWKELDECIKMYDYHKLT